MDRPCCPITTLYPLPHEVPSDTRVYFSISVAQGYFAPITPMGMEMFLAIGRRVGETFAGDRTSRAIPRSRLVVVAGERPFVDVTPVLRDPVGRDFLDRVSAIGEARSSVVFRKLAATIVLPRVAAGGSARCGASCRSSCGRESPCVRCGYGCRPIDRARG